MGNKLNKYSLVACIALALPLAFSSCKKESESIESIVERNYPTRVYIQADRYSVPVNSYALLHNSEGISGDSVSYFTVRLNKPLSKDVEVTLKTTIDKEDLPNVLTLSSKKAVIKAGQIASEPISLTLGTGALLSREGAESYTAQVMIESITSSGGEIQASQNLSSYKVIFSKSARSEDALVVGGESSNDLSSISYIDLNERATKWTVSQVTEGIDGGNDPKHIIDGNFGTDFATNNRSFSFVVDFGRVVPKFRGVHSYFWGDGYAPKEIQLECSVDGVTWTNLGRADISAIMGNDKGYVKLKKAYKARYVRYTITKPANRTSVTEFYAIEDVEEASAENLFSSNGDN